MSMDEAQAVALRQGRAVKDALIAFFGGDDKIGWQLRPVINAIAAAVSASVILVSTILGAIFRITSDLTAVFLSALGDARKANQDATNEVIAAAMTDLLSVDVNSSDIPAGGDTQQQVARAVAIGGKLHDLLIAEFGGGGGPEGIDGERAARAFTGFNINFATSAAVLSIVTEMESLGFFKQFREVGEEMAESLGLGRLHRLALRPLVDNLIAKPYARQLQKRYRQDMLTEEQLVKGLNRKTLADTFVNDQLAQKGLTDDAITEVIAQRTPRLTDREVFELVRHGLLDPQLGSDLLVSDGVPEGIAKLKLQAMQAQRTDRLTETYLSELLSLARDRFIDSATFSTLLDRRNLPDEEAQIWRDRLGIYLESHHKRLTFAQIEKLLVANQINLGDFSAWAEQAGYDATSALDLELIVTLAEQAAAAKAAAAAKKAAGGKKAAAPAPPTP